MPRKNKNKSKSGAAPPPEPAANAAVAESGSPPAAAAPESKGSPPAAAAAAVSVPATATATAVPVAVAPPVAVVTIDSPTPTATSPTTAPSSATAAPAATAPSATAVSVDTSAAVEPSPAGENPHTPHDRPEFTHSVSAVIRDAHDAHRTVLQKQSAALSMAHSDMEARITKRRASMTNPAPAAAATAAASATALASTAAAASVPSSTATTPVKASAAPSATPSSGLGTAARVALFVRRIENAYRLSRDEHDVLSGALNDVEPKPADDWDEPAAPEAGDAKAPSAAAAAPAAGAAAGAGGAKKKSDGKLSAVFRNRLMTFSRNNPLIGVTNAKLNAIQLVALVRSHIADRESKRNILANAKPIVVVPPKPASDGISLVLTPATATATATATVSDVKSTPRRPPLAVDTKSASPAPTAAPAAAAASAANSSRKSLRDVTRLFDFYDRYKTGFIEPKQFSTMCRELSVADDTLDRAFGATQPVSRTQFLLWWRQQQSIAGLSVPLSPKPQPATAAPLPFSRATAAAASPAPLRVTAGATSATASVAPPSPAAGSQRAQMRASIVASFRAIRFALRDIELALRPAGATMFVGGVH